MTAARVTKSALKRVQKQAPPPLVQEKPATKRGRKAEPEPAAPGPKKPREKAKSTTPKGVADFSDKEMSEILGTAPPPKKTPAKKATPGRRKAAPPPAPPPPPVQDAPARGRRARVGEQDPMPRIEPDEELQRILASEEAEEPADRKAWQDLRDRAAYLLVTAAFPTHLRPETVRYLRQIARFTGQPKAIDGEPGLVGIEPRYVQALKLQEHPMVVQARRYVAAGYKLLVSRETTARRPYARIWILKETSPGRAILATIHANGSVQAGHH